MLAVSSSDRLEGVLSEVPTFKEEGLDTEFTIWRGLFGPKDMTDEAYDFWTSKLDELVETDEWKAELERNGWQSEYRNAEDFTTYLEDQDKVIVELLTALDMQK